MPSRLSIKIFSAFFLVSAAGVILMVGCIRFFANRNFEAYIHRKELETLDSVVTRLAAYYVETGTWEPLRRDPPRWRQLTRIPGSGGDGAGERFAPDRPFPPVSMEPPRPGQRPRPNPPPPPHPGAHRRPPPPPRPPFNPDPLDLGPRLTLLDARKRFVAGNRASPAPGSLLPIRSAEETVGWLGLRIGPKPVHPLDQAFLRQQTRVFYLIGGGMLLLSTLSALLLSRHLLAPIRRLARATRQLTRRRFATRIPVSSSDELGDLARSFNIMASRLEAYDRRQQRWLSDISHELRTPLSVIIGEIEAIQDGIRQADGASLNSLHDEAVHINRIVNDLHELAMMEAGGLSMQMAPLDLAQVLRQVIERAQDRFTAGGMRLSSDLNPDTVLWIRGDGDRLRQVFTNLMENALRHAEKPGTLAIRHGRGAAGIRVILEDSGPGVPEGDLPRLFDRLYRTDRSRNRATGGSGLGLAICSAIVHRHNGVIRAANGKAGGLRMELLFPPLPGPPSAEGTTPAAAGSETH